MRRLITVGIILLASASWAGTAAWADTTIDISHGSLNKTANQFSNICDPNQGGGPYPGKDVWVFNLPNEHNNAGVFVSVTATWTTPGGVTETRTIPADGGAIVGGDKGTSKAYIVLPAGWKITAAAAVITGTADKFVVTHTCTTTGTTPTNSPTGKPNPTETPTAPGGGGGGGGGVADPSLPVTGTTVGVLVAAGTIAIAGGAALLWLYRRRRPTV